MKPIAKAGLLLFVVAALSVGLVSAPSNAASTTIKQRSVKTTTRPKTATRPKTTTKRTTSKATTSKATTTSTRSVVSSTIQSANTLGVPPSTAPQTIAVGASDPGASASSPVAFERQRYAFTIGALTTVDVPFFLAITAGFNETLQLRVPQLPTGVLVRFDPNPVRNYFSMTLRAELSALPASDFEIEVTTSSNPRVVLARAAVSLFVTGTTAIAGPIQPTNGDPLAPAGVISSISPSSVQITRGAGAGTIKIELTRQGNYSGPVWFAVSSALPVGVGVSFQGNAISGIVNYLFVSAGSNAVPATFVLTLEIVAGSQRTPIPVTVVIQ